MALEKTIYYKGWKGSGYIIIDPHSGTGAYLIDGGANGGFAFVVGLMIGVLIQTILIGIQSKLFVGISGAAIAELTMVLAPVVIMLTILVGLILINDDKNHTGLICLGAGISAGVGTTAVLDSLFLSKVLYSGALGGAIGTGSGLLGIGSCF